MDALALSGRRCLGGFAILVEAWIHVCERIGRRLSALMTDKMKWTEEQHFRSLDRIGIDK